MALSILDQSPIAEGENAQHALKNSETLAFTAEGLGYNALFYSEHHGVKGYAGSSPEILATHVLAQTKRIKVGTAGIMLRHYSALKVAEWTKMLHALYPGRFILGLGRAPGGLVETIRALNNHRLPKIGDIEEKVKDILGYLKTNQDSNGPIKVQPAVSLGNPEVHWLGSSTNSARLAAENGLGLSYFTFLEESKLDFLNEYINLFQGNGFYTHPKTRATIAVSVAENEDTARKNAYGMVYQFLESKKRIEPQPLKHWKDIERILERTGEEEVFYALLDKVICSTPWEVKGKLKSVQEYYNADELILMSNLFESENRIRNFTYIMENVGLDGE